MKYQNNGQKYTKENYRTENHVLSQNRTYSFIVALVYKRRIHFLVTLLVCVALGELIQLYVICIFNAVLEDRDPAVRRKSACCCRNRTVIENNLKTSCLVNKKSIEACITETIAALLLHKAQCHIIDPAFLPDPAALCMLIRSDINPVVIEDPVIESIDLLLVCHSIRVGNDHINIFKNLILSRT